MSNADQPRIITPDEAKAVLGVASVWSRPIFIADLAYTAAVLGEQLADIQAVFALVADRMDNFAYDELAHVINEGYAA